MRPVTINGQARFEEIVSFEHVTGAYVRVVVGVGAQQGGRFVFDIPQQYQTYIVEDREERRNSMTNAVVRAAQTDYSDLMRPSAQGKPEGEFRRADIWAMVDALRGR